MYLVWRRHHFYTFSLFSRNVRQKIFLSFILFLIKEVCLKSELKQRKTIHLRFFYLTKLLWFFVSFLSFFSRVHLFIWILDLVRKTMHWKYVVEKNTQTGSFFGIIYKEKGRVPGPVASQDITCVITVPHTPLRMGQRRLICPPYNVLIVLSCLSHWQGWCICTDLQLWVEGEWIVSTAQLQVRQKLCSWPVSFCWKVLSNFTNYHITYVHSTLQEVKYYIGGLG